ncbi:hypothetical protein LEP1GSC047_3677 [Leptospira inadai serovar Lyme str. 10]|uniref:Uncharacterized protein n=1 Tax=Leptospira inadai serovar Lyme str. 10 TaxID=1049790 RepID=V6HYC5_9LEPT|nr:hypothetical protein LEP1GSC047_3677 [Leptospira inadai serovar Lyme str. 10]
MNLVGAPAQRTDDGRQKLLAFRGQKTEVRRVSFAHARQ